MFFQKQNLDLPTLNTDTIPTPNLFGMYDYENIFLRPYQTFKFFIEFIELSTSYTVQS